MRGGFRVEPVDEALHALAQRGAVALAQADVALAERLDDLEHLLARMGAQHVAQQVAEQFDP